MECAFGILKSRWRNILQKRLDGGIKFSSKMAVACAVLHSFCINACDDWDDDNDLDDHDPNNRQQCNDIIRDGEDVRDALVDYIY